MVRRYSTVWSAVPISLGPETLSRRSDSPARLVTPHGSYWDLPILAWILELGAEPPRPREPRYLDSHNMRSGNVPNDADRPMPPPLHTSQACTRLAETGRVGACIDPLVHSIPRPGARSSTRCSISAIASPLTTLGAPSRLKLVARDPL